MTILPSENDDYRDLNEFSWTREGWLGSACILTPSGAEELSSAVKTLVERKTPLEIRGGGHMPIGDAANINSTGVLIASSKMRLKELSEDLQTLTVGVGSS
ncbi:hypothetical protein HYALB_00002697 [Hymenoscyphus albidus]|uniref:FAD linked oxidase N-terminal domain-containing protein n=1 Tax=Hymenoscyphus albidus TaxID=595503 RepID=A0A9N9M2Z6_9HELO|nr:hypothetical protein HYALB_00002697 [Hymenoscyphus albidus]